VDAAQIRAFTDEIMYHLAAMLPPEYRGLYADVAEKRPDLIIRYADSSQQASELWPVGRAGWAYPTL
jgi:hypothetical protein